MGISSIPRRQDAQSECQSHRLLQLPQAAGHAGLCLLVSEHEDCDSIVRKSCSSRERCHNLSAALTLRDAVLDSAQPQSSQYCPLWTLIYSERMPRDLVLLSLDQ